MAEVTREQVREVLDDPTIEDLPDGAYWSVVHERLGLPYGRVFEIIVENPTFFGVKEV